MPQISEILSALNAAYTGGSDRVNWVTELKPILDNFANELLLRGIIGVANTSALSSLNGSNYKYAIVTAVGIFGWQSTGTVNGTTVFAASGGGVWSLILSLGGVGNSYEKQVIDIDGESEYSIDWTTDRLAAYGQWPSLSVWMEHEGGSWKQALVQFVANDAVSPTEFTVDFGGVVNAKIIIG